MLKSRLLLSYSGTYLNHFRVLVASYSTMGVIILGYRNDNITYGDIKPNKFIDNRIIQFAVLGDSQISITFEAVEYSSIFIKRLSTGFSIKLTKDSFGSYSALISASEANRLINESDIGKWCDFYIGLTPPHKLLRLLIQTIQNRLRSLRELCAGFCVLRIQEVVC